MTKQFFRVFTGCVILFAAGCGGDDAGQQQAGNGQDPFGDIFGNDGNNQQFTPGGKSVDPGAVGNGAATQPGKKRSRFDLPIGAGNTNNNAVPAGPANPSAGTGFGTVIGSCEYWDGHGNRGGRNEESEFEKMNEAPDVIPPVNWGVKADPPAQPVSFAPMKKNQRVLVPTSSVRNPSGNPVAFAPVPTGVVTVGHNEGKKDKREIWNLMTSEKIGTVTDLGVSTSFNAISPQGNYFAGVIDGSGFDKMIGVYDVNAKKPLTDINLGRIPFFAGIAMPREDLIVAGITTGDTALKAWSLPSCDPAFDVNVATTRKGGLPAFSPGGNYVAIARTSDDHWRHMITIYSLTNGQPEGDLELPDYDIGWYLGIQGLAFSPDGKEIAALMNGWYCSKIIIWNVEDGSIADHITFKKKLGEELLGTFAFSKKNVPLTFFPGNKRLLAYEVGVIDREIGAGVWKLPTDKLHEKFPGSRWPLDDSHVTMLTSAGNSGYVQVYELPEEQIAKSKEQMKRIVAQTPTIPSVYLRPGGMSAVNRAGAQTIVAADIPWSVQPGATSGQASGARSVKLATPRGTLRQIGFSKEGPPHAFALRSSASRFYNRLPAGNVDAQSLITARRFSKPKDDASVASAGGSSKPRAWVDVYDLAAAKRIRELRLTYDGDLVAVSPSGKSILLLAAGSSGRLDLYTTDTGEHLGGWKPFGGGFTDKGQLLVSATMPNDSQIVAFSGAGELTAWDATTGQAVFTAANVSQPACSPDGKYVGYSDGNAYYIVSLANGALSGKIPDTGDVRSAAFHPGGRTLALLSSHNGGYYLFTADLQTGQVTSPFPVPVVSGYMRWFGDRYILVDNKKLVDTQQRVVVWSYDLPTGDNLPIGPDNRHWFVGAADREPLLAAVQMPDPQAAGQLQGTAVKPQFVLQPGGSCALDIQINNPNISAETRQNVEQSVRQQLAANRITVAAGSPVKLVISANETGGEAIQLRFRQFGGGFNAEPEVVSLNLKTTSFRAAFEVDGKTAWDWQASQSNRSHAYFVSRDKNESFQQAIQRSYTNALQGGFSGLTLPPYVFTPQSANGLGTTRLASQ